jgi:hypothetical protein
LDLHDKNVLKNFLKLSSLTSLSPWGNNCFSGDDSRQSTAILTARKTFVNDFYRTRKPLVNKVRRSVVAVILADPFDKAAPPAGAPLGHNPRH